MSPRSGSAGSPGAPMPIRGQGLGLRWQKAANSSASSRGRMHRLPCTNSGAMPAVWPGVLARPDDAPRLAGAVDRHHAAGTRAAHDLMHGRSPRPTVRREANMPDAGGVARARHCSAADEGRHAAEVTTSVLADAVSGYRMAVVIGPIRRIWMRQPWIRARQMQERPTKAIYAAMLFVLVLAGLSGGCVLACCQCVFAAGFPVGCGRL